MEFLKEILGEELFSQLKEKIDAHNGDEANKDKQIKLGNIASGEYVGKGKMDALQEALTGKDTELSKATELIAELKKASKGDESMQAKITEYEQENARLQEELQEIKMKSAIKVALLSEHAVDVDYLTFKLNEKMKEQGTTLELDENDNIKGWDEQIAGLKTQFPTMFESKSESGLGAKIEEKKLGGEGGSGGLTKAEILKKPYAERVALYESNPEAYNEAMKK